MTITGHSILRDRFRRREQAVTLTIMALSVVAVALAFVNGKPQVTLLGVSANVTTWVGSLTIAIFLLALLAALVDWKRSAWAHEDAARRLSELKAKFRSANDAGPIVVSGDVDLRSEYEAILENVAVIPESAFLALKAKHHRKVAVSRLISDHSGAPLVYVRLLAVWRGIRRPAGSTEGEASVEDPPS
jgi:hypothetical protein